MRPTLWRTVCEKGELSTQCLKTRLLDSGGLSKRCLDRLTWYAGIRLAYTARRAAVPLARRLCKVR